MERKWRGDCEEEEEEGEEVWMDLLGVEMVILRIEVEAVVKTEAAGLTAEN